MANLIQKIKKFPNIFLVRHGKTIFNKIELE